MSDQDFQKGEFKVYRSLKEVRMGNPERTIPVDQELEYDGFTLIIDGESMTSVAFRGAVLNDWVAPIEDEDAVYVPKPADIKIGPATNTGAEKTERMPVQTAIEDEQLVGTVEDSKAYREESAKKIQQKDAARSRHKAPRARREAPVQPKPKKFQVQGDAHDQGAVAVGTIESRAKQSSVVDNTGTAQREISRLSSTQGNTPPKVKKIQASGDVQEAMAGDDLGDILPDAVSTGTPLPGVRSDSDADAGESFNWDISRHWKTRVTEAVKLASTDKASFNRVMAMETPKLKKHIRKALSEKAKQG